ncbi:MAG: nucleotidyltransferase domain-containing protein [Elusimicrobia bacterium]|nr:nucleotidyltransferase domain-containing protein [Elusimicrobiota bacterium]
MDQEIQRQIQDVTKQIVDKYQPESILLFGSAARGLWDKESSDLDFLIVKSSVPRRGIDRVLELEKLVDYKIACDFLIYKPEELQERKRLGDPFILAILKESKTLYAKRKSS